MNDVSLIDITIEAMPFSSELRDWCNTHADFKDSLKFSNPDRFMPLGQVLTSRTKNVPDDEIIGFYAYDYVSQRFKQDFIVNRGSTNTEFVLYTSLPSVNRSKYGKYVKHIKEFFSTYGKDGDYSNTHYTDLDGIKVLNHPDLVDRAERAIQNGALIRMHGRRPNTQTELNAVMRIIVEVKQRNNLS